MYKPLGETGAVGARCATRCGLTGAWDTDTVRCGESVVFLGRSSPFSTREGLIEWSRLRRVGRAVIERVMHLEPLSLREFLRRESWEVVDAEL